MKRYFFSGLLGGFSSIALVVLLGAGIATTGGASRSLPLSQFAATTSAQFFGVISDETGSGAVVGASGPTLQGTVTATGNVLIGGTLGVTGAITATGGMTLTRSTAGDGLTVTGGSSNGYGIAATGGGTNGYGGNFTPAGAGNGLIAHSANNGSSFANYADIVGNGNGYQAVGNGTGIALTLNQVGAGYNLYFAPDTTSPAKPVIRWDPADANPSGAALVGDMSLFTGGYLRMVTSAGTPGTYNDVAGFMSVTTGITAFSGGGQASATLVCASAGHFTVGTVAAGNDSVKFPPTPVVGQICRIKNKGANSMNLFPGSGDAICNAGSACGAGDAALAVAANAEVYCYAESVSTWNCK